MSTQNNHFYSVQGNKICQISDGVRNRPTERSETHSSEKNNVRLQGNDNCAFKLKSSYKLLRFTKLPMDEGMDPLIEVKLSSLKVERVTKLFLHRDGDMKIIQSRQVCEITDALREFPVQGIRPQIPGR
jgi:hypothetical protein